jgi:hypothetical protein
MKVRENPVFTVNMYLLIRQRIDLDRSNQLIGQQETLQKVQMEREGIIAVTSFIFTFYCALKPCHFGLRGRIQ